MMIPAPPAVHHFHLSDALIDSTNHVDTHATVVDMAEMNLAFMPYEHCLVSCRPAAFLNSDDWYNQENTDHFPDDSIVYVLLINDVEVRDRDIKLVWAVNSFTIVQDSGQVRNFDISGPPAAGFSPELWASWHKNVQELVGFMGSLFVASINAANVATSTKHNKRAARGIGNGVFRPPMDGVIYLSTSTLAPPTFAPTHTGISPRPHLRRGHIHTFAVGAGRTERVKKFIAPVFVNGKSCQEPPPPRRYVIGPRA